MITEEMRDLAEALAEPFEAAEVKVKPQAVSGNRAMAVFFVDARAVQDRLDKVLGVLGWQDSYQLMPDGSVVCRLSVKVGDEWVTKEDVGSPSEQPDAGDRLKAGFSDSLKRAAVKFGVGRYLYAIKIQWCDYDVQKRQWIRQPRLPDSALPRALDRASPVHEERPPSEESPPPQQPPRKKLHDRILAFEARMVQDGLCQKDQLVNFLVSNYGQTVGAMHVSEWPEERAEQVMKWVRDYKDALAAKVTPATGARAGAAALAAVR